MIFAPNIVPGYGFQKMHILRKTHTVSSTGRAMPGAYEDTGIWFYGMLAAASPKDIEMYRQNEHPVTHTVVQHGAVDVAKENDLLCTDNGGRYRVSVRPSPAGVDSTMIYYVEERRDINERIADTSD